MRCSAMVTGNAAGKRNAMGRQRYVYRRERSELPGDFPQRLERLKEATGLSWRGLARTLRTDPRVIRRWKNGTRPDPGNLYSLFSMAAGMGLLHLLLPEAGSREGEDR